MIHGPNNKYIKRNNETENESSNNHNSLMDLYDPIKSFFFWVGHRDFTWRLQPFGCYNNKFPTVICIYVSNLCNCEKFVPSTIPWVLEWEWEMHLIRIINKLLAAVQSIQSIFARNNPDLSFLAKQSALTNGPLSIYRPLSVEHTLREVDSIYSPSRTHKNKHRKLNHQIWK